MNWLIVYILFLHWIGDFFCQSDWMAQNKSKSFGALYCHVWTYFLVFVLGVPIGNYYIHCSVGVGFLFLNSVLHFITDAITSRINSLLWQRQQMHWFFVSVGFDQLIHTSTLIMTLPNV